MSTDSDTALLETPGRDSSGAVTAGVSNGTLAYRSGRVPVRLLDHPPVAAEATWRDVWALGKPEISFLVVISALAGFVLGSGQSFDFVVMLAALAGIGLTSGGAGSLNHYAERHLDGLMHRTAQRPLPAGRLEPLVSLVFSICTITLGLALLMLFVNALTATLAVIAVLLYVLIYTPLKRRTKYNTLIGAIPGALPALGGWTAATGSIDPGGWALFAILFVWQIPHFLSLAWMYRADYARAGFAMLPVVEPTGDSTAAQTLIYTALLLPVGLLPVVFGLAGVIYTVAALVLAGMFLRHSYQFYRIRSSNKARKVLVASILYIPLLLAGILLDRFIAF